LALRPSPFALTRGWRSGRRLSGSFAVVVRHLSARLIKPNFCFDLPHRRSTTVSLETNPFTQPSFVDQLRNVWISDETLFQVFDIPSQSTDNSWRKSKQKFTEFYDN